VVAKFFLSQEALDDLDSIWDYIAQDDAEAADRVVESAYRACAKLATHPHLGPLRRFPDNSLPEIRFFVLTDFPNYLIFYRIAPEGVEVIRVLHAAQDLDDLFGA